MNKSRQAIVNEYFDKMNENMAGSNKDGVITVEDIAKTYDAKKHPKYLNGEMTERQVLSGFLVNFEADDRVDGRVSVSCAVCCYCRYHKDDCKNDDHDDSISNILSNN